MVSFEDLFIAEVRRQCIFALMANDDLEKEIAKDHTVWSQPRIWYNLQNLLVASANISKLLWSNSDPVFSHGIRSRLNIDDSSELFSRELRNHLEHFDERMTEWNRRSRSHNFIDSNFGIPLSDWDPIDIQRNYNPVTKEFSFRGSTYALIPLIEAIKQLKPKTDT